MAWLICSHLLIIGVCIGFDFDLFLDIVDYDVLGVDQRGIGHGALIHITFLFLATSIADIWIFLVLNSGRVRGTCGIAGGDWTVTRDRFRIWSTFPHEVCKFHLPIR